MKNKLSLFSLAMLIIAAIDSIRNLPSSALFGSSLIFFFIFSAIIFLFPTALVSAQLTATYPEKGGIYHWIQLAFGNKLAMIAIWLQWINTMVWYPTILSFIAGTMAYMINPSLTDNPVYLASMVIAIFWTLTFVSLKGIQFSAKLNSICAILGTVIPMFLLIFFGAVWLFTKRKIMIEFSFSSIIPAFSSMDNFVSLTAIMASYLGMELAGVHITEVENPQKNFPKGLIIAAFFIMITMLLGSLSIAMVIPENEINLVSGVIQFFNYVLTEFHLQALLPIIILAIVLGSTGGIINWLTSPAKGLLHAAEFGYLPKVFTKTNKYEVPYIIMILQAVIVSICCLAFNFVPSVNAFYWYLMGLSTNLYMMMYVLLFLAAIKLSHQKAFKNSIFKIGKTSFGLNITAIFGLFGAILTIIVGFFPAKELGIQNQFAYAMAIFLGMVGMIFCCFGFFYYKKNQSKEVK